MAQLDFLFGLTPLIQPGKRGSEAELEALIGYRNVSSQTPVGCEILRDVDGRVHRGRSAGLSHIRGYTTEAPNVRSGRFSEIGVS